jgi:hypothetical protein
VTAKWDSLNDGPPVWDNFVREAMNDPTLWAALHLVRSGWSREQALLAAVLILSREKRDLIEMKIEALSVSPGPVRFVRSSDGRR